MTELDNKEDSDVGGVLDNYDKVYGVWRDIIYERKHGEFTLTKGDDLSVERLSY